MNGIGWLLVSLFALGYAFITLEHSIKLNKAATALITGVLCWTVVVFTTPDLEHVLKNLDHHFGEISGILFFLLGAMVIVELIDAHDGFDVITDRITTTNKRSLLWLLSFISFFLSAALDNLTTTIVMLSLQRKLLVNRNERLFFAGFTVIAANAGGAWSPLGDVTTTMLWIGGQITAWNIVSSLFIPSLICLMVPLACVSLKVGGSIESPQRTPSIPTGSTAFERNAVFALGLGSLISVPIFKTVTHLPPVMGMLLGLGVMWVLTEFIHSGKDDEEKGVLSVNHAIRKIDTPSILFFLGILLAIGALESASILSVAASALNDAVGSLTTVGILLGFFSAIVDNVPLVAATQAMYSLETYPPDHFFWELLAYCTGTGGSSLIIGSAAGVAAMGLEKIDFFWYFKNISLLAVLGYLAGASVYVLQYGITH